MFPRIAQQFVYVVAVPALLVAASCGRPDKTGALVTETPAVGTSGSPETPAPGDAAATAPLNATSQRDPEAIKALEAMGSYLRTLKAFQVRSQSSRDEVLD